MGAFGTAIEAADMPLRPRRAEGFGKRSLPEMWRVIVATSGN